jgi:hypothetical protein
MRKNRVFLAWAMGARIPGATVEFKTLSIFRSLTTLNAAF